MSSRQTAHTEFTGSAADVLAEYAKMRQADQAIQAERREQAKQSRELAREERERLTQAERMTREVMTPLERYRQKVKEIEQAYESGSIDQETYNRQLNRQHELLNQTTHSSNAAATAVKGFVAGFMGMAGIQKILQAVREEIDNIRERAEKAATMQLTFADAERAALLNFGPERGAEVNAMARRAQKATGGDALAILDAISTGASQKGLGLTDEQLEDAVTTSARLMPGDAGAIRSGAGAIISQMKETGGTGAEIAGQQMAAKALSPVDKNEAFATHIAPGAMNLVKLGLTEQQAYGLMAAGGSAVDDTQGANTANAMLNFMTLLKTKAPQFDNPYDALAFVRSPEGAKLRAELLGPLEAGVQKAGGKVGLTGEKKFLPFMVDMLQAQETAAQRSTAGSVAGIPGLAEAGPQFEQDMAAINANPNQITANLQRRLSAAAQQAQLANVTEGRAHVSREGMREYLQAMGVSAAGQKFAMARLDASTGLGTGGDPIGFLEEEFESRAHDLRRTKHFVAGMAPSAPVEPSRSDLQQAKAFDALAAEMQAIRTAIEQGNAAAQEARANPQPVEVTNQEPPAFVPPPAAQLGARP